MKNKMRTCIYCGRPLELGESCNCRQPVRGTPRDGLRARCPFFRYRSSFHGRYYIACGGIRTAHASCEQRNEHYRQCCCNQYNLCGNYQTMKGEHKSNA